MTAEIFTDPDDPTDDWVDVRMTDPARGEWDVDFVVVDGEVQYVDLRIHPDHLAAFVDCLVDDAGGERARSLLSDLAANNGVDLATPADGDDE